MKMFNRSFSGGVPQCVPNTSQNTWSYNPPRKNKAIGGCSDLEVKRYGIQCKECEGFGQIQAKYANTLKKNNKYQNISWSDDGL